MSNQQHDREHADRTAAARRHLDAYHRPAAARADEATASNAEVNRISPAMTQPMSPEARAEVERKRFQEPALPEGHRQVDPLLRGVTPGEGKLPSRWPSTVRGSTP